MNEPIPTPCPSCGREENGGWFVPCPSDDCPSHEERAALEAEIRTVVEDVVENLPWAPLDLVEAIATRIIRFQMEQREHEAGAYDDCHLYPDTHTVEDHRNPPDYSQLTSAGFIEDGVIEVSRFDGPPGTKMVLDPMNTEVPLHYTPKD